MDKQHGKREETLLKSEQQHVYHIYWSLWRQLSLKKSLLVICKILRLFVNTFPAFEKYSVFNSECLTHPIHMQLSQKQKTFSQFFSPFLKSRLNFEHIQKKMTLLANIFPKLRTSKNVVRWILKKYRFRVPLDEQHGRRAQKLLKSERRYFCHIYRSLWRQFSLKKSILVVCKILRLFVNTFTAYDKYCVLNREYLRQSIHMQFSIKTKVSFWIFFCHFKT